jgi:hypothetical protein
MVTEVGQAEREGPGHGRDLVSPLVQSGGDLARRQPAPPRSDIEVNGVARAVVIM